MEVSEADYCALRSRFRQTLIDDKLVIHRLPNQLIILTFNPNYIKQCQSITMNKIDIQSEIEANTYLCKTDKDVINIPVGGTIVDYNINASKEIHLFQAGLTSSFLVIMKPVNFKEALPSSFISLY